MKNLFTNSIKASSILSLGFFLVLSSISIAKPSKPNESGVSSTESNCAKMCWASCPKDDRGGVSTECAFTCLITCSSSKTTGTTNYTPITKSGINAPPSRSNSWTKKLMHSETRKTSSKQPSVCLKNSIKRSSFKTNKVVALRQAHQQWVEDVKKQYGKNYSNFKVATKKGEWCRYNPIKGKYLCNVFATPCNYPVNTKR